MKNNTVKAVEERVPVETTVNKAQNLETTAPKVITLYEVRVKHFPKELDDLNLDNYVTEVFTKESKALVPLSQPLKGLNEKTSDALWIATFVILLLLTGVLVWSDFSAIN